MVIALVTIYSPPYAIPIKNSIKTPQMFTPVNNATIALT